MDEKYKKLEWTEENLQRFWDYESQFPRRYFTYQVGEVLVKIILKYCKTAKIALDYGSGRGHLIKPLIKQGLKVSALEFSDRSISMLKKDYGGTADFEGVYSLSEIEKLNKKYDIIILSEIFEHLQDKELEETMENVKKLLSNDGLVVITTPNEERLDESMVCCPECQKVFHRWQHVRSWNKTSLKKYLNSYNFDVVDIFAVNLNYEKEKEKFNLRQKIYARIFKNDRKWIYKPHLISIIKMK
jgi:2-polyprenyl-3-methyl-5-hydroxy-6-metoxy-1,4-benzoquinol methylase